MVALVLYGISAAYSLFLLRREIRRDHILNYSLLLAGFIFQTVAMLQRGFSLSRCPIHNLFEATLFISWALLAAFLVIGLFPKFRFLGAFVSQLVFGLGIFALMPALDKSQAPEKMLEGFETSLHASLVLLAYGAFGLAAAAGIMFLCQERDLKSHKIRALVSMMPPIQRLELVISWMLACGFILLTAGLVVGSFFMKPPPGMSLRGDFKVIWSFLVWLMYLGLLVAHWQFAQRGRRLALGAIGSFAFVLLTFWGANLASPIHSP